MSVDLKRGETLPIHINVSFPSLPCEGQLLTQYIPSISWIQGHYLDIILHMVHDFDIYFIVSCCHSVLSVDAIDMSGKHEVDLHTNIWKVPSDVKSLLLSVYATISLSDSCIFF
jgi:hypothetical protein